MNILYIGEETRNWVVTLCNELVPLGHTITAVVKKYDEYDDNNKIEAVDGVTLVEVDDDAYFKPDTVANLLDNIEQYDIVYGSHIIACLPVVHIGKKYNIPYGIQVLDIPLDLIEAQPQRKANWKVYTEVLKDCKTMTFIIPQARDAWKDLTGQYYDDSHLITYPICVSEEYKGVGIDCDDNYIISFCRVTPQRNVAQATASLAQLKNDTKQVVIGKNQGGLDRVMAIANKYGVKVMYEKEVPETEKWELIKNASVVVHTQLSEYLGGLNVWEGMYIGTPTLAYDVDLLKDLYKEHAFYAKRDTPNSYTHMLAYLISVKKEFIKDKLIKASDYASENSYVNAAKKLDIILRGMKNE